MFILFIALLRFSESLTTKYLFLNDELCMVRPTLIDMNPGEVKYYPFMISLRVQSCKLYNKTYMIASGQITNTETFAFIAVLVFMLLSCKVLFINRKNNKNC